MAADGVRFLHTPQWRAAPAKQQIGTYLEAIGLSKDFAIEEIVERLERRYPREYVSFTELVEQRANGFDRADIYELKNSSLEFSLLTGAVYRGAVHRAVMRWVSERKYAPSTVLDLGCDNGILTCFYALLWPDASVTGIDISAAGVARAKDLASLLGVSNASFVVSSIEDFATSEREGQFSLAITTTVIHEAAYFETLEEDGSWFQDEAFAPAFEPSTPQFFRTMARLLHPTEGRWLGGEILTTPHLLWRWVRALESCGLGLQRDACIRLKCDKQLISVLVAGRATVDEATPAWAASYWIRDELPVFGPKTRLPLNFSGVAAKWFFDSIPNKRKVASAVKWDPGRSSIDREANRIEIWLTETQVILYRVSSTMFLKIYFLELRELENARNNWEEVAKSYENSEGLYQRRIDL